jgi:hypothetical protein
MSSSSSARLPASNSVCAFLSALIGLDHIASRSPVRSKPEVEGRRDEFGRCALSVSRSVHYSTKTA